MPRFEPSPAQNAVILQVVESIRRTGRPTPQDLRRLVAAGIPVPVANELFRLTTTKTARRLAPRRRVRQRRRRQLTPAERQMLTSGLKRAAGGALLLGGAALGLVGWLIIRAVRARK